MITFAPDFFMISIIIDPFEPIIMPTFSGSILSSTVTAGVLQSYHLVNVVKIIHHQQFRGKK